LGAPGPQLVSEYEQRAEEQHTIQQEQHGESRVDSGDRQRAGRNGFRERRALENREGGDERSETFVHALERSEASCAVGVPRDEMEVEPRYAPQEPSPKRQFPYGTEHEKAEHEETDMNVDKKCQRVPRWIVSARLTVGLQP